MLGMSPSGGRNARLPKTSCSGKNMRKEVISRPWSVRRCWLMILGSLWRRFKVRVGRDLSKLVGKNGKLHYKFYYSLGICKN